VNEPVKATLFAGEVDKVTGLLLKSAAGDSQPIYKG
jgi:hypothetical protein